MVPFDVAWARSGGNFVIADLLSELSMERVERDTRYLVDNAPMRLAGSDAEVVANRYVCRQLADAGIAYDEQWVDGYLSFPGKASIELLDGSGLVIEAFPFAQGAPTAPEGVELAVVDAGAGGLANYEGLGVAGKAALTELSYSPPRPEKVRIATGLGAVAHIIINWGLPEHGTLPMGTCKSVWGNPTLETMKDMPGIPSLGIRRRDGDVLRAALSRNANLRLRIKSEIRNGWGRFMQPVATIRGAVEPDKYILLGGHVDSWGVGATDNAANNAQLLELARFLQKHRSRLRRSVVFAFWSAHETGMMEGSTWYLDRFWDDVTDNCVMYIGIGSHALRDASEFAIEVTPEAAGFYDGVASRVVPEHERSIRHMRRVGDQSFLGAGIPSAATNFEHTPAIKSAWNNASIGWWYHSDADTIDKVDFDLVRKGLAATGEAVFRLALDAALPFDFVPVAQDIARRASELEGAGIDVGLARIGALAADLERKCALLNNAGRTLGADQVRMAAHNLMLMRLSRLLTPILSTIGGRWDQDPYGYSALSTSLPGLFPIEEMATAAPESAFSKLAWTNVVRQRNRIVDGLRQAHSDLDAHLEPGG